MNNMIYNGYTAKIEYDNEDEIFVGQLAGIRDIVSFHATTVKELKKSFHEAVDDYLFVCKKRNELPQKPYYDELLLHIPPKIYATIANKAEKKY